MVLVLWFLIEVLYQVKEVPFYSCFVERFYHDWTLNSVKGFLCIIQFINIFFLFNIQLGWNWLIDIQMQRVGQDWATELNWLKWWNVSFLRQVSTLSRFIDLLIYWWTQFANNLLKKLSMSISYIGFCFLFFSCNIIVCFSC